MSSVLESIDIENDVEKEKKEEAMQRRRHEALARKALRLSRDKPDLYLQGKPKIVVAIRHIIQSNVFNAIVTMVIFFNTIVLAIYWPGISKQWMDTLDTLNLAFTFFFTLELILKLIGLGYVYVMYGSNVRC
ncbi:hypothetical protein RFI_19503, partial [Reticulomyxa filosa]